MSYPGPYRPPLSGQGPPPPQPVPYPPYYQPPPPGAGAYAAPSAYPYYYPATMMMPVPIAAMPVPIMDQSTQPNTYITNHIYHGQTEVSEVPKDSVQVADLPGKFEWVPTTSTLASSLTDRAVVGGHEGWDGSPLWVIRSWHNGDLIPGKLSIKHSSASIVYDGKEIRVQNIEVLCAKPEIVKWVPAVGGNVPPGAIPGGTTASGETLYVGRARYQLSVTPGKVHPSHKSCYIAFAGSEVSLKMYDVLCRNS